MSSQQALEAFFDAVDDSKDMEGGKLPAITVENGREGKRLSLDKSGFEFISCPTSLTTGEFYRAQHDDALKQQYFDEIISYVESKLGCDKVVCLQMETQNNGGAAMDRDQIKGMGDFYKTAKPQTTTSSRVADELAVSLAGEDHRYQRYAVLSLRRFIEDEEQQHIGQYRHLAVMDERSAVKPDDYITKERVAYGPEGGSSVERYYSLSPRHASNHQWYYFPDMNMDNDAILLKEMDSDWTKTGRMCFQMNVPDPKNDIAALEYVPRKSAEVRMVCFWEMPDSGINSMPTVQQIMQTQPAKKSLFGGLDNSWLDRIMHGESKVHEWLGKIESMSAGLMDGTDKISLSDLVSRATKCQSGTTVTPLNLREDGKGNPEAYYGRYTKEYSDGYDEEYKKHYLEKFLEVVESFPTWPPSSKSWVRSEMRKFGHREVDRGIAEITCVIVDDSMGLVGTKNFPTAEKRKIIDFLIRNETYMHVAMTQWAYLAYDVSLQNQQSIIEEEAPSEAVVEAANMKHTGVIQDQSAPLRDQHHSHMVHPMDRLREQTQDRDDISNPMVNHVDGRRKKNNSIQQDFIPEEEQYMGDASESRKHRRKSNRHHRNYHRDEVPVETRYHNHRPHHAPSLHHMDKERDGMPKRMTHGHRGQHEIIRRRRNNPNYYDGEESAASQTYYEEDRSVMYSKDSRRGGHLGRMARRDSPDYSVDADESCSAMSYQQHHHRRQRSIHRNGSGRDCYEDDESHIYTYNTNSPPYAKDQVRPQMDERGWEQASHPSM
jgi:hypothetical protein